VFLFASYRHRRSLPDSTAALIYSRTCHPAFSRVDRLGVEERGGAECISVSLWRFPVIEAIIKFFFFFLKAQGFNHFASVIKAEYELTRKISSPTVCVSENYYYSES